MPAYIDLTIYALIILLILHINLTRQTNTLSIVVQTLRKLTLSVSILAILYLIRSFVLNETDGFSTSIILFTSFAIYTLMPIIGLFWYQYVKLFIHKTEPFNLYPIDISVIIIINAVLSLLSMFLPIYFTLDGANQFRRGLLFPIYMLIAWYIMFVATLNIVKYKGKLRKSDFIPMLIFVLPAVVGGIFQTINVNYLFTVPGMTLSLVMVHIFIQSGIVKTDYLTGLSNKREFESHFMMLSKKRSKKLRIAGVYIYLDGFKHINDEHGHHVGDQVLKITADILKKSFRQHDLLARIGGDEFAAAVRIHNDEELDRIIERIHHHFRLFNEQDTFPFTIEYSIGKAFLEKKHEDVIAFLDHLDQLMYEDKTNKHLK